MNEKNKYNTTNKNIKKKWRKWKWKWVGNWKPFLFHVIIILALKHKGIANIIINVRKNHIKTNLKFTNC